jgi:hypothetical protein
MHSKQMKVQYLMTFFIDNESHAIASHPAATCDQCHLTGGLVLQRK